MTKPAYERPVLLRHEPGLMNKFGRMRSLRPLEEIDGVPVADLLEQYGSPLFVFSERTLKRRYQELHDALARHRAKVRLAWSYKTNYLGGICRIMHREGAWAEVVSEFEYDKALALGVAPDHIHFNGPYKPESVLERVLPAGAIIHIDHFDELAAAERVAEGAGIEPRVALRLNMAVSGTPPWSRFGFNLESGEAESAIHRLLQGGRLRLTGLHCHLGTFILDPEAYREAAAKLAGLANKLRSEHGILLDFVDLGGGFASHNQLKAQYLPAEQTTPSFSRYAEAIADGLQALEAPPDQQPTVVLETGRALVDDAGFLVSQVQANKRLPDGRRGLVLDAGVNNLFTAFWYNHEVVPAQPFGTTLEPTVMYGPLCMNIDVMRETMLFPALDVGDAVVFRNVGAYNVTQSMQFITYRPAVVLVAEDGRHELLRARENLESVVREERMPSWL